ncbi:MAG: hypothetical protein ACXADS_16000 [Candidatus Thorarchaeota archaeon]|jgi:hypothetical protein
MNYGRMNPRVNGNDEPQFEKVDFFLQKGMSAHAEGQRIWFESGN